MRILYVRVEEKPPKGNPCTWCEFLIMLKGHVKDAAVFEANLGPILIPANTLMTFCWMLEACSRESVEDILGICLKKFEDSGHI
jgi:hypothetical protein